MVTPDEFDRATLRAAKRREAGPVATTARYDRRLGRVIVRLDTGLDIAFAPQDTEGLEQAKPADLEHIEISPSGLGLHFPTLDADLYLPSLLAGFLGSRKWMASRLGAAGGQARTEAKAVASRANGKLGGRPRKSAAE